MHSYTRTFLAVAKFYNIKGICLVLILETLNCYTVKNLVLPSKNYGYALHLHS